MKGSVKKYWSLYKWSNINAMIKNMKQRPEINPEPFKDKLVVITGATSGIGYKTARKYASMGASLLIVNRNPEKSESVRNEISEEFDVPVEHMIADLSVLSEVQKVGQYLLSIDRPIDVLIFNAGVHLQTRQENPDGIEVNFVIHYLCPFVISKMLVPKFERDRTGRIILVGSEAYRFAAWGLDLDDLQWVKRRYSGIKAYGSGKLAQLLFMHVFAEELTSFNVTINAMHPGMVRTRTGRDNGRLYQWYKRNFIDKKSDSPEVSAEALYYLGTSSELEGTTDKFFHLTTEEELTPPALDLEAARLLMAKTIEFLNKEGMAI